MAKTEQLGSGQQISLRERVLSVVDDKILEHPFYSGVNSAIRGLLTPIRRRASDIQYAPGMTPEVFYDLDEYPPGQEGSTPGEFNKELEAEYLAQELKEAEIPLAEEMFEGTDIVLREPGHISKRPDGSRIFWKAKINTWERDFKILGEYFGTGATLADIARDEKIERERARQIYEGRKEVVLAYHGVDNKSPQPDKPQKLWFRRDELVNPESGLSEFIADLEKGFDGEELNNKWGAGKVSKYRQFINEMGISEKVPYTLRMSDPEVRKEFEELEDPDLDPKRKRELLGRVTLGRLGKHGKEALHVTDLMSALRGKSKDEKKEKGESLLYLDPRDLKRVMPILQGVVVHSIPFISGGKTLAYYRLVANGDKGRIREICMSSDELNKYLKSLS